MKHLILSIVLSLMAACSFNAKANSDVNDACTASSEYASLVMDIRQQGVPKRIPMSAAQTADPLIKDLAILIVEKAYEIDIQDSSAAQRLASLWFGEQIFKVCYDSFDGNST